MIILTVVGFCLILPNSRVQAKCKGLGTISSYKWIQIETHEAMSPKANRLTVRASVMHYEMIQLEI